MGYNVLYSIANFLFNNFNSWLNAIALFWEVVFKKIINNLLVRTLFLKFNYL